MTLLKSATTVDTHQLPIAWDSGPRVLEHHRDEWISGSAIAPAIADVALESIRGMGPVLEYLNPAKLGRNLGYATRPVQRARQHYAGPILGGWLAYGHDPLADGVMVPVTFKPDQPRLNSDRKPIKYERPIGSAPRPYFPPLDPQTYETIAARAGLTPPAFRSSWAAWQWLLAQPAVELVLDEGEKKAAAACSHGWLTIGLAGIWNGAPKPKDANGEAFGSHTLIAELQWLRTIRPTGAPLTIAFDASEKPRGRIAIRNARRILGRLLDADGHQVQIREILQPDGAGSFVKGTDDLLVAGGATALAALPVQLFDEWLKATSEAAIRDHLLHPFRTTGRRHRSIDRHFRSTDVPQCAPLVALIGGMGSNKTGAVAALTSDRKLLSITHRRSLADNQGKRFGLPVKREGQVLHALEQSQADLRQVADLLAEHDGFVTVADSSQIGGTGEIKPEHCRGAVLFIDEADAMLRHCLMAETAIRDHRCEVLANLAACVAAADQVLLAGAHIDELTLQAFEAMRGNGTKAHIIESTLQPAAGRQVTMHRKAEGLLQQLRNLATHRQPFVMHTGSKQIGSKMAPANIARMVRRWWPDATVLELTADTIRDPQHAASKAINNPQQLLAFDVVIATPVLETGFSIEDPKQHFRAVLGHTSGHTLPHAFVQSLGRLRSDVPRHIWCNHTGSRIGNGAPLAAEIERTKLEHAHRIAMLHLHEAGEQTGNASRFVRWWSELAADQNWCGMHYRHAVATLLEREGYEVERFDIALEKRFPPCLLRVAAQFKAEGIEVRSIAGYKWPEIQAALDQLDDEAKQGTELTDELKAIGDELVAEDSAAVAAAPAPDAKQLEELEQRQRLTKDQRQMIERGKIKRDLGISKPTAEQVAISRKNAYGKLLQHLLMLDRDARQQWRDHAIRKLTPSQRTFAPDLTGAIAAANRADVLEHLPWLQDLLAMAGTGETVSMDNYEAAHAAAQADGGRWRELLGFDPRRGTARTFVADVLRLLGFKLERTNRRSRSDDGRRWWHYEVIDELQALNRQQVQATIRNAVQH